MTNTDMAIPPAILTLADNRRRDYLADLQHRVELLSASSLSIPALSNSADEVFMSQQRMKAQARADLEVMIADAARLKDAELVRRFCADWVETEEARKAQGPATFLSHDQVMATQRSRQFNSTWREQWDKVPDRIVTDVRVVNDDFLVVPKDAA